MMEQAYPYYPRAATSRRQAVRYGVARLLLGWALAVLCILLVMLPAAFAAEQQMLNRLVLLIFAPGLLTLGYTAVAQWRRL